MWVLLVFSALVAMVVLALARIKIIFFAGYSGGKLVLKLSFGLFFGLLPLSFKGEYAHERVNYQLPWIEVDESLQLLFKSLKAINRDEARSKLTPPVKYIVSASRMAKLQLHCIIGVKDAAKCALLCGLVQGALYAILAPLKWQEDAFPAVDVLPAFNQNCFSLKLEGIAWFIPAQIIFEKSKRTIDKIFYQQNI